MGWLRRLFGVTPKEELDGVRLDTSKAFWELTGTTDFPHLFHALADFLPEGSVLYMEGGSPNEQLRGFLSAHAVDELTHVAVGTIWPRPTYYHVPATRENLVELAKLAERCVEPEIAIHFHVYHGGKVLLEWHDAFAQPLLLAGNLPEDRVRRFAHALSMEVVRTS
jgi:hypothetical protein